MTAKKVKRQPKKTRKRHKTNWDKIVRDVLKLNAVPADIRAQTVTVTLNEMNSSRFKKCAVLEEVLPPVRSADLLPKVEWR